MGASSEQKGVYRQPRRQSRKRGVNVKIGDPSQRQTVLLPPTFRGLEARVDELFGGKSMSLWLDPKAHGRAPGRGQVRISSEADYCRIHDDDVLVLTVDGRRVDAKDLCRISTMRHDFQPLPYAKEKPRRRAAEAGSTAPFFAETSHRRDFQTPPLDFPRTQASELAKDRPHTTGRFNGRSTYRDDYVQHELEKRSKPPADEDRDKGRPFTHLSSYTLDYNGKHATFVAAKPFVPPHTLVKVKAEPMLTTYQANYHAHPLITDANARRKPPATTPSKFFGCSTYKRDYTPKRLGAALRIHIEPEATTTRS